MGRADLIGNSKQHLIPTYQPKGTEGEYKSARKKIRLRQAIRLNEIISKRIIIRIRSVHKGQVLTQHTGLPPRETGEKRPFGGKSKPKSKVRG